MNEKNVTSTQPEGLELLKIIWREQGLVIAWNEQVRRQMMSDGNIKFVTQLLLAHCEDLLSEYDHQPSGLYIPK
jgi:hypothetical protein